MISSFLSKPTLANKFFSNAVKNTISSASKSKYADVYKTQKMVFNNATLEILNTAIPQIVHIVDPVRETEIFKKAQTKITDEEYNKEESEKVTNFLISRLVGHCTVPETVFGPLGKLTGKHKTEELCQTIDKVLAEATGN